MSSERDMHFQGFAKLLWQKYAEIDKAWFDRVPDEEFVQEVQAAFAGAAYDFANHILRQLDGYFTWNAYTESPMELIAKENPILDMTEWPNQEDPLQGKGRTD